MSGSPCWPRLHSGSLLIPVEDIENETNPNAPPPQNNNNRGGEIISLEIKEVCGCVREMHRVVKSLGQTLFSISRKTLFE